jgi:hypothetical protein
MSPALNLRSASAPTSVEYPGLILIDALIQSVLQGIIFAQGVHYWTNHGTDSMKKRAYVGGLIFLAV